jgi:hypothetical protein
MNVDRVTEYGITITIQPEEARALAQALEDLETGPVDEWLIHASMSGAFQALAEAGLLAQQQADTRQSLDNAWGVIRQARRQEKWAGLPLSREAEKDLEDMARQIYLEEQSNRARAGDWEDFQGAHPSAAAAVEEYRANYQLFTTTTSDEVDHLLTPGQLAFLLEHTCKTPPSPAGESG